MSSHKNLVDFTLIYNRYKTRIYNYVLRMVNDQMLCEDIVQSVFLKLYENMTLIRDKERIVFWLFTTARNEIYTFYRGKKSKVDQFNVKDSHELELKQNESLEEEIEIEDLKEMVLQYLSTMAEDQSEVFLLKEYGGLSYKEISKVMSIDENLVKSRLYKTRQKLIKKISKIM